MERQSKEAEKVRQLELAKEILTALNLPYRDGNVEGTEGAVLIFQTQPLATDNHRPEEHQLAIKKTSNDDNKNAGWVPFVAELHCSSKAVSAQDLQLPPRCEKRERKPWSATQSFNNNAPPLETQRSITSQRQNSKANRDLQRKLVNIPICNRSATNRLEKASDKTPAPSKAFKHQQYSSGHHERRRGRQTPSPHSHWLIVYWGVDDDEHVPRNAKRPTRHEMPRRRDPAYWDPNSADYKRVVMAQN